MPTDTTIQDVTNENESSVGLVITRAARGRISDAIHLPVRITRTMRLTHEVI